MQPLEYVAAAFGLLSVYFTMRQSIWCWPTGLVNVALYLVVFYHARLYSDVVLQAIYIPLQIYGWWHWVHGVRGTGVVLVTRLTPEAAAAWAAVAAMLIGVQGYVMHRYFGAALPWWDAAIAVLSLIAQYLLARKVLESWLIWIAVDILAIGVYFSRGLYPTTVLYGVFLLMATLGLITWIRFRRTQSQPLPGFEVVVA